MLILAIWLTLIGYSVLITGKRNMGISYQAQQDGSIKAVDNAGKPAKSFGIADVLTCGPASGSLPGRPATSPTPAARQAPPPLDPNLFPFPLPNFTPAANPLPQIKLPPVPVPNPIPGVGGLVDTIARDVHGVLQPIVTGIEGELGRLRIPGLVTARPQL